MTLPANADKIESAVMFSPIDTLRGYELNNRDCWDPDVGFKCEKGEALELTRYVRRFESRMTEGIRTVVTYVPAVESFSVAGIRIPLGPTGLGASAARIGHESRVSNPDRFSFGQSERSLQDIDFGCPWPLRVSPFLEQARCHALEWMQKFGLTQDPEANEALYRDWKLGEAAAFFWPDATPEGLDLGADLMGWYFAPFDDQFDGDLGKIPHLAAEICADLIAILEMPTNEPLPASYLPVTVAFSDIWWRSCRGMSPAWRQRAAQHWKQYIVGQLAEVINRRHNRSLDTISHLRQRVVTTSSDVISDLIERLSGFEVPDMAWQTPVLYELRQLTAEIVAITNDLVSAEKEEAQGDTTNNLLLILENQERCSRDEAIERMRQMTHERFARFLRLEQQISDLDDVLPPDGQIAVRRHVQGLHDILAGDNEWEHTSGRYATTATGQPAESSQKTKLHAYLMCRK